MEEVELNMEEAKSNNFVCETLMKLWNAHRHFANWPPLDFKIGPLFLERLYCQPPTPVLPEKSHDESQVLSALGSQQALGAADFSLAPRPFPSLLVRRFRHWFSMASTTTSRTIQNALIVWLCFKTRKRSGTFFHDETSWISSRYQILVHVACVAAAAGLLLL